MLMAIDINQNILTRRLELLRARLLQSRSAGGYWQGKLSSSALATATAVFALATVNKTKYSTLIERGLSWLAANRNSDGGWGDSLLSASNISTTMLCWAAFSAAPDTSRYETVIADAESWLARCAGTVQPELIAEAVNQAYGRDRTFSAPILTMCALAGRLGEPSSAWRLIEPLPFELAACPYWLFKWLRLSVVSYALPALIAVGQVNYYYRKPKNPIFRALRRLTKGRALTVLKNIQPNNGGFLEAVPLTSFVVMSLAAAGKKNSSIVSKGIEFLINSVRDNGSWPIDTNLATWVTTLSINAIAAGPDLKNTISTDDRRALQQWLLDQQYKKVHPYTNAAPGGWAWTNLPGGVPDADDTAGALIALRNLDLLNDEVINAAAAGLKWLLGVQNRDGGIATFCRGWTALEFDRSAPDLTAHSIQAMIAYSDLVPGSLASDLKRATRKAMIYLANVQKEDGSWIPLWFGNEHAPLQQNPTYGTATVLSRLQNLPLALIHDYAPQNQDGAWAAAQSISPSIEETALAVHALAGWLYQMTVHTDSSELLIAQTQVMRPAVSKGVRWLLDKSPDAMTASPIGLYFAKLWYFEQLYPLIFTLSALEQVNRFYSTISQG